MSWISQILGGSTTGLITGVAGAIDRFVETDEEKKAAELLLIKMQQDPDRWQTEINKIEAGHRSLFVAGPRPFIMWVCGAGLSLNFIVFPITEWIVKLMEINVLMPNIETGPLMTLVLSLLGLGSLRTYEKRHNLTK